MEEPFLHYQSVICSNKRSLVEDFFSLFHEQPAQEVSFNQ